MSHFGFTWWWQLWCGFMTFVIFAEGFVWTFRYINLWLKQNALTLLICKIESEVKP